MAEAETRTVHIWDDPESRIQFLETILQGQAWEGVIYHPSLNEERLPGGPHPLSSMAQELQARGYKTELGADKNGIPTLNLKHFGNNTKLLEATREMGLVKGVGYKLGNLGEPLGDAMHKTASFIKQVAGDKARLAGALYGVADTTLIFSGMGNKSENSSALAKLKDPANVLESMLGVCGLIQSYIFMAFSKEGSGAMYKELMDKAEAAEKQGTSLFDDALWKEGRESKWPGPLAAVEQVLKKNPIASGAAVQILGKASLLSAGGIRLARTMKGETASPLGLAEQRRGAISDMVGSLSSMAGWTLLLKGKKEKDPNIDELPWNDPKRIWQTVQSEPNKFAAPFLAMSSVMGVTAAKDKKNKVQLLGNSTFLAGDALIFAMGSGPSDAAGRAALLATAAEQFIENAPLVLGKEEQKQFVGQVCDYLAERSLRDATQKGEVGPTKEAIAELSGKISYGLKAKLPTIHPKAYELAGRAAAIVDQFHPEFAETISGTLALAISENPNVVMGVDELKETIIQQVDAGKTPSSKLVQMKDVAEPISQLLFAIPGGANAETANRLYDALDNHIRPTPRDPQQLENAINTTAERDMMLATQKEQGRHLAALALARQSETGQGAPSR